MPKQYKSTKHLAAPVYVVRKIMRDTRIPFVPQLEVEWHLAADRFTLIDTTFEDIVLVGWFNARYLAWQ